MKRRTVKRILTYVRPYRAAFAASCASALLYVLFTLLGPVFTGRAIDNILGPGQVAYCTIWRCWEFRCCWPQPASG